MLTYIWCFSYIWDEFSCLFLADSENFVFAFQYLWLALSKKSNYVIGFLYPTRFPIKQLSMIIFRAFVAPQLCIWDSLACAGGVVAMHVYFLAVVNYRCFFIVRRRCFTSSIAWPLNACYPSSTKWMEKEVGSC